MLENYPGCLLELLESLSDSGHVQDLANREPRSHILNSTEQTL